MASIEPRFMKEGFAVYGNNPFVTIAGQKEQVRSGNPTGVKLDSPQWAIDEYEQWKKNQEQSSFMNIKL